MMDIANGDIPTDVARLLSHSRLIAIPKPDGSPRPIALLESVRNVAGNLLLSQLMPTLKKNFFGLQFAVGVNGGVECCIHAFRTVLMDNPNLAGLLIDFENMFNEISREGVLLAVHRQCPDAYPFIYSFYSKGAKIRFQSGDSSYENLFSTQGVFQGDVWGSIASCCLLLDFQSKLNERLLDKNFQTLQLAIADDLTIIGHPNSIIAAWEFISEYAPPKLSGIIAPEPFALKIKVSKCKVFSLAPL